MKNKIIEYRCDICGKNMRRCISYTHNTIHDYKVKIKRRNFKTTIAFNEPITLSTWEKLDVCEECMDKIVEKIKEESKCGSD